MSPEASSLSLSRSGAVFVAAVLGVHALLGIDAARRLTVTHDEYWHVPAGLVAWRTSRFDCDHLNPPLTRMWAAWPLLFTGAKCDAARIGAGEAAALGHQFLNDNPDRYEFHLALARSMNVVWSVLTGLVLALWSWRLFGGKAACLTAAMWAFCPTVLANAALVTPDAGGACLFVVTLYASWLFSRRPTWGLALLLGLALGLAQLAKFTNLLLYPLVVVVWRLARPADVKTERRPRRLLVLQGLVAAAISVLVLNAGYLFQGSLTRFGDYDFQSRVLRNETIAGLLRPVPLPLPRDYLAGVDRQRAVMEAAHPVYLDGRWSLEGFPDYYLRTLQYKLPHAVQFLFLLALLFVAFPGREPRLMRTQLLLLLPAVVLVAVAGAVRMQLGIRYILPALPLLYLFAGQVARWFDNRGDRVRLRSALVAVAALALPFSLRYHPHHLGYFNELAGGPLGGRTHLLDSNLDWGQDLGEVKRYLDEHRIEEVGLAYFGMYPPSKLGLRYHVPGRLPAPGWYAISVNFLYGRPHTVCEPDGTVRPVDIGEFAWLSQFHATAHIGYSIDVIHVTADDLGFAR